MTNKFVVLVAGVAAAVLLAVITARTTGRIPAQSPSNVQPVTPSKAPIFTPSPADEQDEDEVVRNAARAVKGEGKTIIPPREERLFYLTMGEKHNFQASENVLGQMGLPEEQVTRLRKHLRAEIAIIVELIDKHLDESKLGGPDPADQRIARVEALLAQELGDRYREFRAAQLRERTRLVREYVRTHKLKSSR
jgi:hypothetical protein